MNKAYSKLLLLLPFYTNLKRRACTPYFFYINILKWYMMDRVWFWGEVSWKHNNCFWIIKAEKCFTIFREVSKYYIRQHLFKALKIVKLVLGRNLAWLMIYLEGSCTCWWRPCPLGSPTRPGPASSLAPSAPARAFGPPARASSDRICNHIILI